jgi:hypothetical protein
LIFNKKIELLEIAVLAKLSVKDTSLRTKVIYAQRTKAREFLK